MAFAEYRNPCKKSTADEFDIERFAYDVFAYMLRICGFPEAKIPTSSLKENKYNGTDFVRNVGLSALPIALYEREEWRFVFKELFQDNKILNIQSVKIEVRNTLACSQEYEEEDTLSKIQFSLAFLTELTLFLNLMGVKARFDYLPKLWSGLCKEIVEDSEDSYQTLESLLTMYPDMSESWITRFISNVAIPYGSSNDVSDRFSFYAIMFSPEFDVLPLEAATEKVAATNKPVPQLSEILDSVTRLPENN